MLKRSARGDGAAPKTFRHGRQRLILDDCFAWLARAQANSISAAICDPPYGLVEYEAEQQRKLRAGKGGVWRIPPSFDGAKRMPLPRFTVLSAADRREIATYFARFGKRLLRVLRPGGHVAIAGNPLVCHLVSYAMERAGFEKRGELVRLVRTFRGGDRPKGVEMEFSHVSSMPRSHFEPWGLFRKRLGEQTLAANLRRWGTGGLRRTERDRPPSDVIASGVTPRAERLLAPHPSLKPQRFLRHVAQMLLPLGEGEILDPFAGSGSTLAACEALGLAGVGVETDREYFDMATRAIPRLALLGGDAGHDASDSIVPESAGLRRKHVCGDGLGGKNGAKRQRHV